MLATIPFHRDLNCSKQRAKLDNGKLKHILDPQYHGNPISSQGSLVFTDFGWDMLEMIRSAGFSDISVEVYASIEFSHLGGGQIVFRAIADDSIKFEAAEIIRASAEQPADSYAKAIKRERQNFGRRKIVHDLPKIFHYWSNKHLRPIFNAAGISTLDRFFADQLVSSLDPKSSSNLRFLSIGAGNCDMEVASV